MGKGILSANYSFKITSAISVIGLKRGVFQINWNFPFQFPNELNEELRKTLKLAVKKAGLGDKLNV